MLSAKKRVNQGSAGQPGGTVYIVAPDGMAGGAGNAAAGSIEFDTGAPKGAGATGTVNTRIATATYQLLATSVQVHAASNTARIIVGDNNVAGLWAGLIKAADGVVGGSAVQFGLDMTLRGGTNSDVTDAKPGNLYLMAGEQIAGGNKRPGADVTIAPTTSNDVTKKPGFFVWYNGAMLTAEQAEPADVWFSTNQMVLWMNSAATGKSHLTAKTQATGGHMLTETVVPALTVL